MRGKCLLKGADGAYMLRTKVLLHTILGPRRKEISLKLLAELIPVELSKYRKMGLKLQLQPNLLINRELSEMSILRTQIKTENQNKDTDVKERELKIKELALVERERKNKPEESRLKQYFEEKEFELKITEPEFKRKCIEETERIAEQELRLREKETSLLERVSRIERKIELKEEDLISRERFLSQKEKGKWKPTNKDIT
ncbi:DNA ligase 1-like [Dreissena polymorpha]|uniref:Uncharacterized protein n=1 Tax=Dreissena polymorpha TaxID=45954 RepID=A0A9D4C1V9_DREPO|nr:DNA ligase 1-like [Dreissena polymorpha]KAH3715796.1 hypothetical protein DPMN_058509 [Dreissena polymorpha]